MTRIIKISLACLFILCLLKMPYGFYQLVRFLAFAGFCFLAYEANEQSDKKISVVFVVLAVLFQPFFKIALGRDLWNVIDVIAAVFLLATVSTKRNQ